MNDNFDDISEFIDDSEQTGSTFATLKEKLFENFPNTKKSFTFFVAPNIIVCFKKFKDYYFVPKAFTYPISEIFVSAKRVSLSWSVSLFGV